MKKIYLANYVMFFIVVLAIAASAYTITFNSPSDSGTSYKNSITVNATINAENIEYFDIILNNSERALRVSPSYNSKNFVIFQNLIKGNYTYRAIAELSDSTKVYSEIVSIELTECIEDIQFTDWNMWTYVECNGEQMNSSRFRIEYDANNCGTFENITHFEYQLIGPLWQNTTWSNWEDIGECMITNKQNQTRNLTQYDLYGCGTNTTFYDYRTIECEYIYEDCYIDGETIRHGSEISVFLEPKVPFGFECQMEWAECYNGELMAPQAYQYYNCKTVYDIGLSYRFWSPGNFLELSKSLGNVQPILDESLMNILSSRRIRTEMGTVNTRYFLKFPSNPESLRVVYENIEDNVADYLTISDNEILFSYKAEFIEGLKSTTYKYNNYSETAFKGEDEIGYLVDLDDVRLNILGEYYTILNSSIDDNENLNIALISGDIIDRMEAGETKVYELDGNLYEISVIIIADANPEFNISEGVKFMINGNVTHLMHKGDVKELENGILLKIDYIRVYPDSDPENNGRVFFYLGARILEFNSSDGSAMINKEIIENAEIKINATWEQDIATIWDISYELKSEKFYIPSNEYLRNHISNQNAMLSNMWDIYYEGLSYHNGLIMPNVYVVSNNAFAPFMRFHELNVGDTNFYRTSNINYEVSAIIIYQNKSARLMINGEITPIMQIGDAKILSDDSVIRIMDIQISENTEKITFYLTDNESNSADRYNTNFQDCNLRNMIIPHGKNITAYLNYEVPYSSICESETRICSNGILSGSYEHLTCTIGLCIPNIINTEWSGWSNTTCYGPHINQTRFKIEYDENNCGTFENVTHYEYRLLEAELSFTEWSSWNNVSCSLDSMNQSRFRIEFDANNLGCFENVTHYEFQLVGPFWQNTTWSDWTNISTCMITDQQNQTRSLTQYDTYGCATNITHIEYRFIECNYCTYNVTFTDWSNWQNEGCINETHRNQSRYRIEYDANYNTCYAITGLESDLWNNGENITHYEYRLQPDLSCAIRNVLTVCMEGCQYNQIQGAMWDVKSGETIFVHNGIYTEVDFYRKNNVWIIGESKGGVLIRESTNGQYLASGMIVEETYNSRVVNISFTKGHQGIWVGNATNNLFVNIETYENNNSGIVFTRKAHNNVVRDSILRNQKMGAFIVLASNITLDNIYFMNITYEGVYINRSENNTIKDSKLYYNNKGIYIEYPEEDRNTISNNLYRNRICDIEYDQGECYDFTPPKTIDDLIAYPGIDNFNVILNWTAVGGNWHYGVALGYIVKYSTEGPITDNNWDDAIQYTQVWIPPLSGEDESKIIVMPTYGRYWFAIRAFDRNYNLAATSNSPSSISPFHEPILESMTCHHVKDGEVCNLGHYYGRTTAYLYDVLNVSGYPSNYGPAKNATFYVRNRADQRETEIFEIPELAMSYPVSIMHEIYESGDYRLFMCLQGILDTCILHRTPVDDIIMENFRTWSLEHDANLFFNREDQDPAAEITSSEIFKVGIRVRNNESNYGPDPYGQIYENFYGLPIQLLINGTFTVNRTNHRMSQGRYIINCGESTIETSCEMDVTYSQQFYVPRLIEWTINPMPPGTYNVTAVIGNPGDQQSITRIINVVES